MENIEFECKVPYNIKKINADVLSHSLTPFASEIYLSTDKTYRKCNAKSSIGILSLGIEKEDNVIFELKGINCTNDAEKLKNILNYYNM
ncbi:MAG: HPr family phosphocarrier protein [Oscillospiraceae bacterium]